MWHSIFLAATSFWLALATRAPTATKKLLNSKARANSSAAHHVAEEAQECAKYARTARDWLRRASLSVDIGEAALTVEDGRPADAAGRHAQLWTKVAEQEAEVAQQSIQAAKLESSTQKFMARLESQQQELFAGKDKFLKRVKTIKLNQADQAQQERELEKAESAMARLRQWPQANNIRISVEMRRLSDMRQKHAENDEQLAKNISDVQNGLKQTEKEVAVWEGRKKILQELGDKLDSTSSALRERKRELYRQDRMLEGLEMLLSQDRGKAPEKSSQAASAETLNRRNSLEKLLGKAQARLGAGRVAIQALLQKLKPNSQFEGVKPATMEAMRVLSDGNTQVSAGLKTIGHVGGETEALSVAKVAILDVQTGFVTAVKHLEKCMPENAHDKVTSRPIHQNSIGASNRSHPSNSKAKERSPASSSGSDPSEMLRKTLRAFRSAAEEASAEGASKSETSSGQASISRLSKAVSKASHAGDVPDDLQQKIKQLAREVRAANKAAGSLLSTESEMKN